MPNSSRWSVALARFLFSLARRAAFCFFERSEVLWFTSPPPGEIQRGCIPSAVGWLACFPRPSGRLFWFNNAKRKKSHLTISSHMLLNRLSFIKPYNRPSGVKKQANLTTFEKYAPLYFSPGGGDVNHTTSLRLWKTLQPPCGRGKQANRPTAVEIHPLWSPAGPTYPPRGGTVNHKPRCARKKQKTSLRLMENLTTALRARRSPPSPLQKKSPCSLKTLLIFMLYYK